MSTDNQDPSNNSANPEGATPPADPPSKSQDELVQEMVARKVNEELASIKSKLDDAYKARDAAAAEKARLEEQARAANIKRLEEEGKHKEVYELRLAEQTAKNEALKQRLIQLERDQVVKDHLRGVEFRNPTAADMAYERILAQTVQNEDGQWLHKSGVSIREYVEHFQKQDDNEFLFKAKQASGLGDGLRFQQPENKPTKPLKEMSSEELLQAFMPKAGQAPTFGNF